MNLQNEKVAMKLYSAMRKAIDFIDRDGNSDPPYTIRPSDVAAFCEALALAEENPKVTDVFADKQIGRLAGMRFFPAKQPAVIAEMVRALMGAPDEEIARKVIDGYAKVYSNEDVCPSPGDIMRAISEAWTARDGPITADHDCLRCGGAGSYEPVEGRGFRGCSCFARRHPKVWERTSDSQPSLHS